MRRRAFHATAGTLLIPGCGALTGGNGGGKNTPDLHSDEIGVDPDGDYDTNVDVPDVDAEVDGVGVDATVGEIGVDVNNSELDTDIDTGISVGIGDEHRTATPENPKATKHIAEARKSLVEAHKKYAAQGRRRSILTITPMSGSVNWIRLKRDVKSAMDSLENAAEYATRGQALNIAALEHVGYFLLLGAKTDARLAGAYKHFEFSRDRLYNESLTQSELARKRMYDDYQKARDIFQELRQKIKGQSMGAFPPLSELDFDRKIRQLDNTVAAFRGFNKTLRATGRGMEHAETGVDAYLGDEFEKAERSFTRASARFSVATVPMTIISGDTGLHTASQDLLTVVTTMEQASRDLQRSAQGKLDDERLIYYEAKRAAEEHIKSNEIVSDMSIFRDIAY